MISNLDRKLWRDLRRLKGQAIAVALVMACGLAMMIMARSLIYSLESTRREYYQANHFADVFVHLKRAPNSVAARIAELPGVATVQPAISVQVTLDLAALDEPASGMVRSVPDFGLPELNRLFLRSGRWLNPANRREVLVGEAFAQANQLEPGDRITMLLNGRRQDFQIAGIVLSPEFIFESRPGAALPDNRTYGIFWMPYTELARAFDLDGAFNYLSLTLAPDAAQRPVLEAVDRLLTPYGGRTAYGREDHPSHIRVSDEIRVLQTISIGFPIVFLSVAAFMTNAVLSRLLALQREQIAILKAFGFSNRQIVGHYLKFALVMVVAGTLLGAIGGILLGHRLVLLYHKFFRFPELEFRLDQTAFPLAVAVSAAAAIAGVIGAVRRAARLPPAEAMRPEPPANYRPALVERTGIGRFLSHTFRIAVRNIERRPVQACFTVMGLALATGILIVPNCFRDGVAEVLDFQWDVVQRQDLGIGLVEPAHYRVKHLLGQLPGVVTVEPFRHAFVRISFGHQRRQLGLQGIPADGLHNRVLDENSRRILLPPDGIVVSAKLAEILGARVGDLLTLEFLEGKRPVRTVPLVGLAEDFAGTAAYMELRSVNRLLGEGDLITGANFRVDSARQPEFLRALKEIPRVSWVAIKNSLRENFRQTTAASIGLIQMIYLGFATVVAFGVVYNNARISLAERARELATLRVIGFSRREVGAVLITELVILALIAVPLGLLIGTGFAKVILGAVNTETVRLPLVLTSSNYAFAVLVVTVASSLSALAVLRKLGQLDLVGVLKAPE
ncbi:MAG TPA: FtsX-like permease family protein [Verrucomicrobiota bacterium]|nr:FtsX-like permease family protein [Verrucomicrobiota bacterium]HRT57849.1 FtsX-like permease family protein [Candidatus Paceibacterota bacterium]